MARHLLIAASFRARASQAQQTASRQWKVRSMVLLGAQAATKEQRTKNVEVVVCDRSNKTIPVRIPPKEGPTFDGPASIVAAKT